jgi:3-O-methylgallate 3,4-dioxygenase
VDVSHYDALLQALEATGPEVTTSVEPPVMPQSATPVVVQTPPEPKVVAPVASFDVAVVAPPPVEPVTVAPVQRESVQVAAVTVAAEPVAPEPVATQAVVTETAEMEPAVMQARYDTALGHVAHLGRCLRQARLDALVIVGDDQKELFQSHNMPSVLVYHGATIRNVPLRNRPGPEWARAASARYYEPHTPRDYPVHAELALHIVDRLIDAEFDLAVADTLPEGQGEGHAFGFVHSRLLEGEALPVVPIFLNTYYPPNQPTPRRCHRLGQALRAAIRAFPADLRVGVLASGGLSHFTVNETLDAEVMRALRENDSQALTALPSELLNAGNSEIRNWICMAGAVDHLRLQSIDYVPGYRTPAGTGTGLCFAVWQ